MIESESRLTNSTPTNARDWIQTWRLIGYVQGIVEGNNLQTPTGVNKGQLVAIVKKHMAENPRKLHLTAEELVVEAIASTFPQDSATSPIWITGHELKEMSESNNNIINSRPTNASDVNNAAKLIGYTLGIIEGNNLPYTNRATSGQLIGFVKKYVAANPGKLHLSGEEIVVEAITDGLK
jgi:hypothetical protein